MDLKQICTGMAFNRRFTLAHNASSPMYSKSNRFKLASTASKMCFRLRPPLFAW